MKIKTRQNKINPSQKTKRIIPALLAFLLWAGASAFALPQGESVEAGSASFNKPDANTLNITASDKTVINYNSFNIGPQETVNFVQPGADASVLNRVTGSAPSSILGKLFANGILFLVNTNGINIGSTANIQANVFVASTLDISTNNFVNGNYIFEHTPGKVFAQILNKGLIAANNVALIASAVDNQGVIFARAGKINLASGDKATVSFDARGYLQVEINAETSAEVISLEDGKPLDAAVANSGTLEAKAVMMTAKTAANIFKQAVNQTGIIKGSGMVEENGTIRIVANKEVQVSGTLEAANGNIKVISDESVLINNSLDLKGEAQFSSNNKDILVNGKITQTQGKLSLNAPHGGIYDLNIPIQAKDLTLLSPLIKATTQAENITVLRDGANMHLTSSSRSAELITLEGDDLFLAYPLAARLTLKTDQAITSLPGVIIQGGSVNLLANRFGTSGQPLQIDSPSIFITSLNNNIDILESQGIGNTVLLRGPPEFGSLAFNQDANVTLETLTGSINVAKDATLFANNLTLKSKKDIYSQGTLEAAQTLSLLADGAISSLGVLKAEKLVEKGASFLLGGTSDVKSSSIENADGAITYNSGNFSGTYSDAVDIIIGTNAIINLTGNTIFQADSDANGSGAFIMNAGSSIVGNNNNLTISASQGSTLRAISGVGTLTVQASKSGTNPTYTANNVLTVNTVTISASTLFMNSLDLVTNSITNNGTLRGANYYVSISGGNDSNPGTYQGKAWKTIGKVNTIALQPGDNVLFKRGDTWIGEGLIINRSGVSGSPITIGAYGTGANPLFRAAKTVSELGKSWSYDSGNIYYITGIDYWLNYAVDTNGAVLWRKNSKGEMTAGSSYYDSGAGRLYVWSYAGGTPSTSVIIPSNIDGGVVELRPNQSYVNVNNIDVKYANHDGIRISSDYSDINDCNVDYAGGAGFYWFHNWPNAVGADYSQSYRDTARRTNIVGSQAFTVEGSNIWIYDSLAEDNYMAGFDFLDYSSNTNASFSGVVRSISRRNGQRAGSWDPNFYVDGGHDITIDDCLSELPGYNNPNSNSGITVSIENAGHVTYNIIIKNTVSITNKGYALSIGSFTGDKPTNIQVYNNTFIDNTGNWMLVYVEKLGGAGVIMKNNIFYASHGTVLGRWTAADAAYVHSDYNNYYTTGSTAVVIDGVNRTFDAWKSYSGQDTNSISSNPLFVSATDFHLQTTSPAINKGTNLPEVTTDCEGTPRPQGAAFDIGVFEYISGPVGPITLTVSGITASNKVYDGLTAAAVNYTNAILNGVLSGDTVSFSTTNATANFANENAGSNKTITIAGITLSGASAYKYTLTQPTVTASITPRPLTVNATATNKVYDGSTAATVNLTDNRIAGDTLAASYVSAAFANKNVGSAKTVSITGISLSGADAANYTYNTTASATANITVRPLTVTAATDSRVYNGSTTSSVLPVITSGSLASGDSASWTQIFNNKNAGSGKTLTPSGTVNDGNSGSNYAVTFINNTNGAITPATLTLNGLSAANKVYDASTAAIVNFGAAALSGVIGTDAVSLNTASATGSFANKNAGTNKTVSISGISLSGIDSANYTLNPVAPTTASITPRPLTIGATAVNKVYDGTTTANATLSDNRLSGDSLLTSYGAANFADKNAANNKTVNITGIILSGTDATNYTFNTTASTTASITPRPITVSAVADTRVYNGLISSSVVPQITSGSLAPSDTASWTQNFNNKNAGTNKTLTPAGSVNDGNSGANYTVSFANNTNGTITPATLTLIGISATNKAYDGSTAAAVNFGSAALSGVIGTDAVSLNTASAAGSFANKNAGTNKTVSISGISIAGTDSANYTLSPTASTTASITPRALSISATGNNKVYDGSTTAAVALTDNRISGDVFTASYAANFTDKNTGNTKLINITGITLSGSDATNYTYNTTATATANITARPITVSAVADTRVYNASISSSAIPQITSGSLAAGDSATWSQSFNNKNAGTNKTLEPAGLINDGNNGNNYILTLVNNANGTITPATLTLTGLSAANKIYDGTTAAIVNFGGAALAGILGSDNVTLNASSATANFSNKNAGTNKTVSISGISIAGTDSANYTLSPTASTTASITPRALSISATGNNKVYDGSTTASVTLNDNRINGDSLNTVYGSANFTDKNAADNKTINVAGISISGLDAANYTFNPTATATAGITPRALAVSATGVNKVYNGTTNADVTLSDNRIAGDSLSATYASATFADPNTGTNKPVNVNGISISGTDAANYTYNTTAQTTANITAASSGSTYIFTGTGDWLNSLLWSLGAIPAASDTVIIDGTANLSGNVAGLNSLTINSGRSLNLAGYNIGTTNGITNNGTLYLAGNETITGSVIHAAASTTEYRGAGSYSGLAAGYNYGNLNFNGSGTWVLGNNLNVGGNLSINSSGTLNNNAKNIDLSGNLSNNGLIRYSGSGAIALANGNDATHGTWEFYNTGLIPNFNYNNIIISGGSVSAPTGTLKVGGNFTHSAGTFNHNNGTVDFNGGNQALTLLPSTKFYNVIFSGSSGTGPTIYLQLDGNAADASGNNNNGTAYNTSTSTDVSPTNFLNTQSISFNGSNSYIVIPSSSTLSGTFTISMWIKPGTSSGTLGLIGSRSPQDASFDVKLQNGNTLHADIGTGAYWITPAADGALSYAANTWYNIVYSVTPTSYTIYANGSQIGSGSFNAGTPLLYDANHNLMIGRTGVSWGEYFNGNIDDLRVYNRSLSSAEILALSSGNDLGSTKTINGSLQVEGNLTVNPGVTLDANNQNISVGGNWTNNGAFIAGTNTVTLNGTGSQQVKTGGLNSKFNILDITNNSADGVIFTDALYAGTLNATNGIKKLSFATGSGIVHTISSSLNLSGASGALLKLAPATAGQTWYLNAPISTLRYVDVSYSSQAAGKLLTAISSIDGGNNNVNWKFVSSTYTFAGTGDWLNSLLWSLGAVPGSGDTVVIDGACILSANVPLLNTLTINSGRSLNLAGYNIGTTNGLTNNGTLYLAGNETITGSIINAAASTVEYRGTGTYSGLAAGNNYGNLNFNGSGTWKLGNNLNIGGNLLINAGALDNSGKNITLSGNLSNNGLIRYSGSGAIALANGNDATHGTWEFYNTGAIPNFDYYNMVISGGTLTAPSGTMKVAGNFTHSGGTFKHNNGTIDFNGTDQTLTLLTSTKFYNLIFSGATGAGPLIYLTLDGAAADASGNNNNGTAYNTTASTEVAPTNFLNTQSISFNGSNSYIVIPSSSTLSGTFTISMWIKPGTSSGTLGLIGSRSPQDASFDVKLQNGNTLHADIGTGAYWITPAADGALSYAANTWYNIVYSVTPTSYTVYANGQQIGSGTFGAGTPLLYDANHNLMIGRTGVSWGEYFNGNIDDLRVYNRSLSASEISTLAAGNEIGATKNISGAALQVQGNLTINPGVKLNTNNKNITVGGNWTNNGVFTAGTSKVTLNGTGLQQVKTGGESSKFNILTVNNKSASGVTFTDALYAGTLNATNGVKKLTFATGSDIVHTITTRLNLAGTSGSLLKLAPATPGQTWYLNAPTSTLRYIDVNYSSQAAGKLITAINSINGGNNIRWSITP